MIKILRYGEVSADEIFARAVPEVDVTEIVRDIIENVKKRELDTETLCNIITVEPSKKYQSRIVYIDMSIYLANTSK